MSDLTEQCLEEVRKPVRQKFEQDFNLADLRHAFCSECRNPECEHARFSENPWEDRMSTQVERLLENPHFGDIRDPRWSHLQEMDFPSLFRESIRLHLAQERGDWSVPTQGEVDAAMGNLGPDRSDTGPNPEVEQAVQALKKLHTVIQIHSKTQPGVVYDVTLDGGGQAISCTCMAGKHGRRCTHRIWGEQEYQRRKRDGDTGAPEPPPEPPERPPENRGDEAPLPVLGVRGKPPGGRQEPLQGLAKNTPLPSQGLLLEGAPADGLRRVARDPWAKPAKPTTPVSPSGVQITIGKKEDE